MSLADGYAQCYFKDSAFTAIGYRLPNEVSTKLPNQWDLYDMHGNVTDPIGPETGTDRMTRGGAWQLVAQYGRSASRFIISPPYRFTFQGFRIVKTAE